MEKMRKKLRMVKRGSLLTHNSSRTCKVKGSKERPIERPCSRGQNSLEIQGRARKTHLFKPRPGSNPQKVTFFRRQKKVESGPKTKTLVTLMGFYGRPVALGGLSVAGTAGGGVREKKNFGVGQKSQKNSPAGAKNVGKKIQKIFSKKKFSDFLPDPGSTFSFFWSTKKSMVRGASGRPLRGWVLVPPKKFQIFVLGQKRRLRTSATSGFRTQIEKKKFFFSNFFRL